MIDVQKSFEAYEREGIAEIGWVHSQYNLADHDTFPTDECD